MFSKLSRLKYNPFKVPTFLELKSSNDLYNSLPSILSTFSKYSLRLAYIEYLMVSPSHLGSTISYIF